MGLYANFIAPWLVDCACGTKPIAYQRRKIIPRATGVVLEIGAGGGRNFALYDREKVERLIALEPDAAMVKRGRARAPEGLPLEWLQRVARLPRKFDAGTQAPVATYANSQILVPAKRRPGRNLHLRIAPAMGRRVNWLHIDVGDTRKCTR